MEREPGPPKRTAADDLLSGPSRRTIDEPKRPRFPQAEIRNLYCVGEKDRCWLDFRYGGVDIPALAPVAVPPSPVEKWKKQRPKTEEDLKRADLPVRVVEIPGAHRHMFLNEQIVVLQRINSFLDTLPK
jgi:hypothetical protein